MKRQFQARWLPTLATLLALGLLLTLGTWQTLRFQEKLADEALRDARQHLEVVEIHSTADLQPELDHRMAAVRGQLNTSTNFLIKHRIRNGKPGFWLINALTIDGTQDTLLINRGWLPYPHGRELIETLDTPTGTAEFTGLLHFPSRVIIDSTYSEQQESTLSPSRSTAPIELESYDLITIAAELGLPATTHPVVLTLGEDFSGNPYPHASFENITSIYLTSEKHLGYALTWYILAISLVAMYVAAGFGLLRSEKFR